MTTKFTDNRTGEEYEFLGTNITFSERELIHLEEEYDEAEDKRLVERLISTGFFEEEWTDYYAETDVDAEDDDNVNDGTETETTEESEVESVYLEKDSSVDTEEAARGTESQFNVPIFHKNPTVANHDDTDDTAFTFPVPVTRKVDVVAVPKMKRMVPIPCRCPLHIGVGRIDIKFAATMSQLRRVRGHIYMLNVVN